MIKYLLTIQQGTIHGTSLSSAIAYIRSIFGLNHGICWLNATCVYAAKIKLNHCGTNYHNVYQHLQLMQNSKIYLS